MRRLGAVALMLDRRVDGGQEERRAGLCRGCHYASAEIGARSSEAGEPGSAAASCFSLRDSRVARLASHARCIAVLTRIRANLRIHPHAYNQLSARMYSSALMLTTLEDLPRPRSQDARMKDSNRCSVHPRRPVRPRRPAPQNSTECGTRKIKEGSRRKRASGRKQPENRALLV